MLWFFCSKTFQASGFMISLSLSFFPSFFPLLSEISIMLLPKGNSGTSPTDQILDGLPLFLMPSETSFL